MKKILIPLASLILFASCSNEYYSHRSVNIERKDVMITPMVADLSVDLSKKITVESSLRNNFESAKDEAYYKAITENNVDVVVDPIYDITTTPKILFWGGKAKAKVTGYGAKFANVKKIADAVNEYKLDTNNIRNFKTLVITGNETKNGAYGQKPMNSKKRSFIILGILAVGLKLLGVF